MNNIWRKFGFLIFATAILVLVYGSITLTGSSYAASDQNSKYEKLQAQLNQVQEELKNQKLKINTNEQKCTENKIQIDQLNQQLANKKNNDENISTTTPANIKTKVVTSFKNTQNQSQPIDNSNQPIKQYATLDIAGIGHYDIEVKDEDTAFDVLIRASNQYKFTIKYKEYSGLGVYIECIGGICAQDRMYWALYYNGLFSKVGTSALKIKFKDIVSLRYESW